MSIPFSSFSTDKKSSIGRYETAREMKVAQDDYCERALAGDWHSLSGKEFPESLQWEALVDVLRGRVKVIKKKDVHN